jgi:hypothetical protein
MSAEDWIKGLSRIATRCDLPITLQGGEPTLHQGFYEIANTLHNLNRHLDLLTNGMFDLRDFNLSKDVFRRGAKYASIRFSYHPAMNQTALVSTAYWMQQHGYEVGIWGLDNNKELNEQMAHLCDGLGIDFRLKEYLDKDHGTYKYPEAISGRNKKALCKINELLIGPSGHIFKCHADLYANRNPIGNILDYDIPEFRFRECENYGTCNPCDVKLKTNRLQEFGYCAVEIKGDE